MKKILTALQHSPLFAGIDAKDLPALLSCLNARERAMQKEEIVLDAGDEPRYVGVVLAGSVRVVQEDYWGNRTILMIVPAGGLFAEAFSCAGVEAMPVCVVAHEEGTVLLIDCRRILTSCSSACSFHAVLIQNMVKILAGKNVMLTRKMEHITKKTTREKLLSYLSECAAAAGGDAFEIPFNRQELADYLSVERSALSSILSKLKDDGMLTYNKNQFVLLQKAEL